MSKSAAARYRASAQGREAYARWRNSAKGKASMARGRKKYAQINMGATNTFKEWTSRELNYISERAVDSSYLRSAKACALHLDRSVRAVERARWRIRQQAKP